MGVKLTLESLMARKRQRDQDKVECKSVYVENLGGELTIRKLPLPKFLDILDEINDGSSAGEAMRAQMELIYECCPLLHNPELQQEYDCVEPTDIVGKVFDDNLMDISTVVASIFEFYGMDSEDMLEEVKKDLKN